MIEALAVLPVQAVSLSPVPALRDVRRNYQQPPDPICRRIERRRQLWAEYSTTLYTPEPPLRTAAHDRWEAEIERALNNWAAAFEVMVSTTPRTADGAVRLLDTFLASESEGLEAAAAALLTSLRRFVRTLA